MVGSSRRPRFSYPRLVHGPNSTSTRHRQATQATVDTDTLGRYALVDVGTSASARNATPLLYTLSIHWRTSHTRIARWGLVWLDGDHTGTEPSLTPAFLCSAEPATPWIHITMTTASVLSCMTLTELTPIPYSLATRARWGFPSTICMRLRHETWVEARNCTKNQYQSL